MKMTSFITAVQTCGQRIYSVEITEDGCSLFQKLLSEISKAITSTAFQYAKGSGDNAVEALEIQRAASSHISHVLAQYALMEGMKAIMKANIVPDETADPWEIVEMTPEQMNDAITASELIFPVIDMFQEMKNRDPSVAVAFRAAMYLAAMLQYLATKLLEHATKSLNGEKVNSQHILVAIEGDPELKGTFSAQSSEAVEAEAVEATSLLNEIITILKIDRSTLRPGSEEAMQRLESRMELPIPIYLRAMWQVSDGSWPVHSKVYLFPSIADVEEQFFYNQSLPKIYRMNRWIPYLDVDYDFCWEVLDVTSGGVILHFDLETNQFYQYGREGTPLLTFLTRLRLFRDFLLTLPDATVTGSSSSVSSEQYKEYEKSCGFARDFMSHIYERKYSFANHKIDWAERRHSAES